MNKYFKSKEHINNINIAGEKGRKKIQENKENRIKKYYLDPKLCKECLSPIEYKKKSSNSFCNSSCASKHNNKKRTPSEEQKLKTSNTLKLKYKNKELLSNFNNLNNRILYNIKNNKSCIITIKKCNICNKLFIRRYNSKVKTCSTECAIKLSFKDRKYQNGRKKTILYNNNIQGIILLDSTWELTIAKLLDSKNIKWIRPEPIKWIDSQKKSRLYFPDFYLLDYSVFLDPKNPYCLKKDQEKLNILCKDINLIYGHLNKIIEYIEKLTKTIK